MGVFGEDAVEGSVSVSEVGAAQPQSRVLSPGSHFDHPDQRPQSHSSSARPACHAYQYWWEVQTRAKRRKNKGIRAKPIINGPVLSSARNASHSHRRRRKKEQSSLEREEKEGEGGRYVSARKGNEMK